MKHWLHQLRACLEELGADDIGVMVTVVRVRGSCPREAGAKMFVSKRGCLGSIGGGQLEHQCQQLALGFVGEKNLVTPLKRNFPLGTNCGQCCGGAVDILFEPIHPAIPSWLEDAVRGLAEEQTMHLCTDINNGRKRLLSDAEAPNNDWHDDVRLSKTELIERIYPAPTRIALFGAGHVGRAVVQVLASLNCRVHWIDSRPGLFSVEADHVRPIHSPDPAAYAAELPAGTLCLVMTHSHPLDFDVCAKLLAREDIPFCGLIGSQSKRNRFERLFTQAGLSAAQIAKLTCPIGIDGIDGKAPAEIAVSVAAQLLQQAAQLSHSSNKHKDTSVAAVSS